MSTESLRSRKPAEGKEDQEREERTGNHRGGKRRGGVDAAYRDNIRQKFCRSLFGERISDVDCRVSKCVRSVKFSIRENVTKAGAIMRSMCRLTGRASPLSDAAALDTKTLTVHSL